MPKSVADALSETAAEAVHAEATGKTRTVAFGPAFTAELPEKWKRFKFMRAMARGDMGAALDAVWPPASDGTPHPVVAAIEDLDLTEEEFNAAMESLAEAVAGTSRGN